MPDMKNFSEAFLSGDLTEVLTRYSDIILAGVVVGIIGMMIIPLPTFVLDILLTMNITFAVTILLVAIYVPSAVRFASFPTVLLIATLFRLALNVSSTRLILLQADAGEVIRSFGNFVVQGNFVVGAIIFLILTLIQFIVFSKGSERVAEVAARFTLDALPGKQMSIDADVRAGSLSMEEAKVKRAQLQRESQLYGSMDGAMKFVKGDAIAGIIITIINIVGGLIIGVLQKGMSAGEAAQTYSLLTIGDGLVSQIPALLHSTSAGMVVTRVASEFEDSHLGKDIGTQLLDQPKAIAITSGLLLALGIIPGLPTVPFFALSAVTGGVAYGLLRTRVKKVEEAAEIEQAALEKAATGAGLPPGLPKAPGAPPKPGAPKGPQPESLVSLVTPIALDVSRELTPYVDSSLDQGHFMNELIPLVREGLYQELGVRLPGVRVRGYSAALQPDMYVVRINEIPVVVGKILEGRILANAAPNDLKIFNVKGIASRNPATGGPACWIPEEKKEIVEKAGYRTWDPPGMMTLTLSGVMKRYASEFLGIQEVQTMLEQMQQAFPTLVKEVQKVVTPLLLSDVLKNLVKEEISIRDFRTVLQAIVRWAAIEKETIMLTEYVRTDLKEQISFKFSGGKRTIYVNMLDPELEDIIRNSVHTSPAGKYLSLDPNIHEDLSGILYKEFKDSMFAPQRPIVLTTLDVRPWFKKLVETDYPRLVVLSYQELTRETRIQPVGQIRLSD